MFVIACGGAKGLLAALGCEGRLLVFVERRDLNYPGSTYNLRFALRLYSATTLSLVVALTQIGVANGLMRRRRPRRWSAA